jgi:rhodanese-related sulfurtransferase
MNELSTGFFQQSGRLPVPYTLVQVNFNFSGSRSSYEATTFPMAGQLAAISGLRWKVWLINEADGEAGGIYLFGTAGAAQGFVPQLEAMLRGDPSFGGISIKPFEVLEAHSIVTRGLPMRQRTFGGMAAEALAEVPAISPAEAQRRLDSDPDTLVIDVRDAADIAVTGTIPGALNISYGALTYQADHEVPETWRASQLADTGRPIITTCILGPLGALGGKLLHDMGYTNVQILEGGVQAWIEAGLPVAKNGSG